MGPRRIGQDDLASALPPGGRVLVGSCSGESLWLADAVMRAGGRIGATTFTGVFVPGLNTRTYLANPDCRVETFFLTPELKAAGAAAKFLPLCYADILARLRSSASTRRCSWPRRRMRRGFAASARWSIFSPNSGRRIPVRIAHINPRLPRVASPCAIPFDA